MLDSADVSVWGMGQPSFLLPLSLSKDTPLIREASDLLWA